LSAVNAHFEGTSRIRTKWGHMSRKARLTAGPPKARKTDRRVRRTRDVLGDVLVELMQEKPFEEITVQQVLERARVSRSTFYTHYRDKNDLFLGDVEDFFEMMANHLVRCGEVSNRVAPVRELFGHVAQVREFYAALVVSGKIHDTMELGKGYFARSIEQRLSTLCPEDKGSCERAALAYALAGALWSLLSWWIDHGTKASPAEMDEIYHRMVWSGVSADKGVRMSLTKMPSTGTTSFTA
jgi:AcrR family transcriptional regulator